MKMFLNLSLAIVSDPLSTAPITHGMVRRELRDPPLDSDDEENAVRLAEQMVREAFRRARENRGALPTTG